MADRPILFSAPMVLALLDGRKTQTRRLATSPLRRVAVGDRLWVREHWKTAKGNDGVPPRDLDPLSPVLMLADNVVPTRYFPKETGQHRQAMHMPRWASRVTLIVEAARVQPLQAISETDAIAEGIERGVNPITGDEDGWRDYSVIHDGPHKGGKHPHAIAPWGSGVRSYQSLWERLHGPESWAGNPDVVALTFRVERGNIDRTSNG